ncbi:MAG UNVERIFIED_CONTAM: ComF family protein [Rickettsiaceae bacterium]|jgi:ComF family protein
MNKIKRLFRLYNHAQILAYELASLVEKKIIYDILIKSRNTKSQTSLSEKDRRKNLFGSITVQNKEKIKGKKILLIDDVITTGSTVDLCAKQLKKSGAKEVIILSIARTSK